MYNTPNNPNNPAQNPKIHFRRRCWMVSGRFEGFNNWRSVVAHGIMAFGGYLMVRWFYTDVLKPSYEYFKPKFAGYTTFVRDEWKGKREQEAKEAYEKEQLLQLYEEYKQFVDKETTSE